MTYCPQKRQPPALPKSPFNQKFSPSARSPRVTPSKSSMHMHSLKDFNHFYGVSRPILSKEKKLMIEEKLKPDYEVRASIQNRNREDYLFVKFLGNPFSKENLTRQMTPFEKFEEQLLKKRRRGKEPNERQHLEPPESNIIYAINNLQQNQFHINLLSSVDLHREFQELDEEDKPEVLAEDCKPSSKTEDILYLDEILTMDDDNFYSKKQVQINIFQFLRGEHRPFLSMDILHKYYFHFTSLTQKLDKVKFPTLRDLSQIGRKLAKGKLMDSNTLLSLILSSETMVKPADLRFQDILGVASGRFTTELAYSAINQEIMRMEFTAQVSEIELQEIHYPEGTSNHQQNFVGRDEARQQIQDYKLLPNDSGEQKFSNYCKKSQANLRNELSTKRSLIKNTIKDKKLYNQIDRRVRENIGHLANMAKTEGGATADRLIRFNKANKNRKEAILIRNLLKSITLSNREEEKIQQLLKAKATGTTGKG